MLLNATGITSEERADAWLAAIKDSGESHVRSADSHLQVDKFS